MTDEHRSLASAAPGHRRLQAVRALGLRFLRLAWTFVLPLARVLSLRWRPRTGAEVERITAAQPRTTAVQPRNGRCADRAHGYSDRFALPEVEVVEVAPEFDERLYATTFALLQLGPRAKLLDLRAAHVIKVKLFERLASAWQAPHGTVPRLGILLGYESWAVLRNVAARRLRPIADQGVEIEIFYAQQVDSLPVWFAHGEVHHDHLRDVIEWLRTQWRPTAIWPTVLSTTAMLVQASAEADAVPEILLELAAIARSFEGVEGAEQAAKHARAALSWVGDPPSRARCRVLRALAAATMSQGEIEAALELLEMAITAAAVIRDRIEEASAVAEIGFHALRSGHVARAEARFRGAIALLSIDDQPYLRATLHHHLALALHAQRRDDDEAEHHASVALALRWDKASRLASKDRALLALIRASRRSEGQCNDLHGHRPPRTHD